MEASDSDELSAFSSKPKKERGQMRRNTLSPASARAMILDAMNDQAAVAQPVVQDSSPIKQEHTSPEIKARLARRGTLSPATASRMLLDVHEPGEPSPETSAASDTSIEETTKPAPSICPSSNCSPLQFTRSNGSVETFEEIQKNLVDEANASNGSSTDDSFDRLLEAENALMGLQLSVDVNPTIEEIPEKSAYVTQT